MRNMLLAIPLAFAASASAGPHNQGDTDSDGVFDPVDFCVQDPTAPIPCSLDTDADGYGNACDGDFNNDGVINATDSGLYLPDLASMSPTPGVGTDMNCDGVINATDSGAYLDQLTATVPVPGPSGLVCAGTVPCP